MTALIVILIALAGVIVTGFLVTSPAKAAQPRRTGRR